MSKSILTKAFEDKDALIGYVTFGDYSIEFTYQVCVAMIDEGVDVIELSQDLIVFEMSASAASGKKSSMKTPPPALIALIQSVGSACRWLVTRFEYPRMD